MIAKTARHATIAPMESHEPHQGGRTTSYARMIWLTALYAMDQLVEWLLTRARIIRRESDVFLGVFLFLVGALTIHAARFCDGNSADYLSCTRPAVYYYYSGFNSALIIAGVFLVLLWYLSRNRER